MTRKKISWHYIRCENEAKELVAKKTKNVPQHIKFLFDGSSDMIVAFCKHKFTVKEAEQEINKDPNQDGVKIELIY